MGLNWRYTVGWIVFAAFVLAVEVMLPVGLRDISRAVAVLIFAVLEGLAIQRAKAGDTLSEHVWAFYAGKPARVPLLLAFAGFAAVALVNIPTDPDLTVGRAPLTVVILGGGLLGWLVPHFIFRGRYG